MHILHNVKWMHNIMTSHECIYFTNGRERGTEQTGGAHKEIEDKNCYAFSQTALWSAIVIRKLIDKEGNIYSSPTDSSTIKWMLFLLFLLHLPFNWKSHFQYLVMPSIFNSYTIVMWDQKHLIKEYRLQDLWMKGS